MLGVLRTQIEHTEHVCPSTPLQIVNLKIVWRARGQEDLGLQTALSRTTHNVDVWKWE